LTGLSEGEGGRRRPNSFPAGGKKKGRCSKLESPNHTGGKGENFPFAKECGTPRKRVRKRPSRQEEIGGFQLRGTGKRRLKTEGEEKVGEYECGKFFSPHMSEKGKNLGLWGKEGGRAYSLSQEKGNAERNVWRCFLGRDKKVKEI